MLQAPFEPRGPLEAGSVRSIAAAWAVVFILLSAGGAFVSLHPHVANVMPHPHAATAAPTGAGEDDAAR